MPHCRNIGRSGRAAILAGLACLIASIACSAQNKPETVTQEQQEGIDQLNTIGYLGAENPAVEKSGVTMYDKDMAYRGLNLYVAGHAPEATLMDMDGKVLHTWRCEFNTVWPGRKPPTEDAGASNWRRARLFDNGDLLAIFEGVGLIRIDKDSKLLWTFSGYAHHDMKIMENGDIFVLTRNAHMVPRVNADKPILEDGIALLDGQGNVKREVSMLEMIERSPYWPLVKGLIPKEGGDIFHTNTLQWLDGSKEKLSPLFKRGNILTSLKTINVLAIVDFDAASIVWLRPGPWEGQHEPVLLDNGNILLLDNNRFCDYSRVVEYEPFTAHIPWYYMGTPPSNFFTKACGACQPLPNGNILIVESEHGRAFEITHDKKMVWRYVTPHTIGEGKDKLVAYMYDLVRLKPDTPLDWLSK